MGDINWLQVFIGFASGGAFGALLKIGYDLYVGRRQPIVYSVDQTRIFSSSPSVAVLQADLTVRYNGDSVPFSNLSVIKMSLKNRGNSDFGTFEFGITLPDSQKVILSECEADDRHHSIVEIDPATPTSPKSRADFRLTPLNRADEYFVKLYVFSTGDCLYQKDIKVSSASPVRLMQSRRPEDWMRYAYVLASVTGMGGAVIAMLVQMLARLIR